MTYCGGELLWFYQLALPTVWLWQEIARRKVEVPVRCSPGLRPVVTNDYCIKQRPLEKEESNELGKQGRVLLGGRRSCLTERVLFSTQHAFILK